MKRISALRELRRLLSRSELPPVDVALKAGAIPVLVQCLSFGSPDEQVAFHGCYFTNYFSPCSYNTLNESMLLTLGMIVVKTST